MNTEEKKAFFIKWSPFIFSVIPVMVADWMTFGPKSCVILFFVDLCILFAVLKVFGKNVDIKKQIISYCCLYLLSVFVKNLTVFLSCVYSLFSEHMITHFLFCTAACFVLLAKLHFVPGKADEKLVKAFIVVLSLVFAVSLFCSFSMGSLLLLPVLFGVVCWQLTENAKENRNRLPNLLCFLAGALLATTQGIWMDGIITFKDTEKNVENVKETAAVVEEVKDNQHSPLIAAIMAGDKEKVRNSAGTDINVVEKSDDYASSPLIAAVIKGDAEIVDILIKAGADVNLRLENGDTAIGAAIKENNFKIAEMLTNAGAAMAARRDMSIWLLAWFGGVQKRQPDLRIFGLLREKKVPFFIEETTLLERLFFPFGLIH